MINYRTENIDTEKFEKAIDEKIHDATDRQNLEVAKIEQYFEGYRDALYSVKSMLYCSNYKKDKQKEGKQMNYKELKSMIKEGRINEDTKIECWIPDFPVDYTYINTTLKEILNILKEEELEYVLFTIFNESEDK